MTIPNFITKPPQNIIKYKEKREKEILVLLEDIDHALNFIEQGGFLYEYIRVCHTSQKSKAFIPQAKEIKDFCKAIAKGIRVDAANEYRGFDFYDMQSIKKYHDCYLQTKILKPPSNFLLCLYEKGEFSPDEEALKFLENYKKGQERAKIVQERAKIVQERANELSNKAFIDSVRKKLGLKEQETKRAIYKFISLMYETFSPQDLREYFAEFDRFALIEQKERFA
ncbi:hypothetical protein [Helicobacter bilis]|uniref:Uncharacterized protein n=3 Tax=Helicobacter bilis TaxID=37372 RepID=A0A099V1Z8_9HELI|nr:hypothetical protein [Helicobacter bilis]TLE08566.1 hypothetical protein LS79_009655 [Helicobacter bilis]